MVVIDAHSDYALHVYREHKKGNKDILKEQHLPFLRDGRINIEVLTVGGDFDLFPEFDSQDYNTILQVIDSIHNEIYNNSDLFILIKNSIDLDKIKENEKIGFILALEGANSIENDFSRLYKYYDLGLRSVAITHNNKNQFADGCAENPAKGLSNLGKKFIEELNSLNILIDLSHISEPSFWDVLDIIEKPPIATHSNVKALCNHARNLTDTQIESIAERNGVIGMNFFNLFLDENKSSVTTERLIDHIDHIVDLVGIDHVGLGPDFLNYYIEDLQELDEQLADPFGDLSEPDDVFEVLGDVSRFPILFELLQKRGYSDNEVRKIQGENFLRVFKKILK
ncbi:MAG: dipeptidase [Candidatus Lokiarchaeota archaeon]|nr:dipeptidase [Candidatus Lokiarchaeota archaeon]